MTGRRREQVAVLWPDQAPPPEGDPGQDLPEVGSAEQGTVAAQAVPSARRPVLLRARTWLAVGIGAVLAVQAAWAVALGLAHRSAVPSGLIPVASTGALPPPAPAASTPSVQQRPATAGATAAASAAGRARSGPPRPADLAGWAQRLAPQVGIPAVALAAYGNAERVLAGEDPGCHLSWVAVAGIGRIESDHGRFGGAVLRPDGRSDPPVVGIALDGNGVATIRDSDGGRLDGDPVHDRAVGPMQFIPTTWARYAADADGDGVADPFSLPDAALAAGRYLCRAGGGDLRTPGPWTNAVLAYNASTSYLQRVTQAGNGYAAASFG